MKHHYFSYTWILFLFLIIGFQSPAQTTVSEAQKIFDTARSFDQQNNSDSASQHFQKAADAFWSLYKRDKNQQYLQYYLYSADLNTYHLLQLGNYENAIKNVELAIDNTNSLIDPTNELYGNLYSTKALALKALARYNEAYLTYRKCLKIRRSILGENNPKLASIYYNLGELAINMGKYEEATRYLDKDIKISSSSGQANPSQLMISHNNMGIAYLYQAKFQQAKSHLEKSLYIAENSNVPSSVLLESYKNIGLAYDAIGDYNNALEYFNKAADIAKNQPSLSTSPVILKNLGEMETKTGNYSRAIQYLEDAQKNLKIQADYNPILMGEVNNSLGKVWEKKGNYNKAREFYQSALELHSENKNNNPEALIITYNNLANFSDLTGNNDQGIKYLEKAIGLQEGNTSINKTNLAKSYGNLGKIYLNIGKFEKAQKYIQRSLSIYFDLYPDKDHPELSTAYNNLGNLYNKTGRYNKALDYYQKDLDLSTKFFGNNSPGVAASYNNLANVYFNKREFERALEFYNKALSIYQASYGDDHPSVIGIYNNLGNLHENKENFDQARRYHKKALSLKQQIYGEDYPGLADSYNNLGNSYFSNEQYDSAITFYTRAIDINIGLHGENHVNIAKGYGNLSNIYREKEQYGKAKYYYQRSARIFEQTLGEKHPETASTYSNLGHVYFDEGRYKDAAFAYQKAIVADIESYNDTVSILEKPKTKTVLDQHILLEALLNKGDALKKYAENASDRAQEKYKNAALAHYVLSDSLIREIRKGTHTRGDKMALGLKAYRVYSSALELCMDKAQSANNEQERKTYIRKAFSFSEKNKSRVLLQSISDAKAIKFAGIPEEELNREKELKIKIDYHRDELIQTDDESAKSALRNKLFELKREYEALIKNFERKYPKYYQLKHSSNNVTISKLQNTLDDKTAILSYFVSDSLLSYFYISSEDYWANSVDKPDHFRDSVELFRNGLIYKNSKRFQKHYKNLGNKFYQQLLPPRIDQNISQLLIIPDGVLNNFPFEALLTEPVYNKQLNYTQLPYLIKKYNISYSYSATLFNEIFNRYKQEEEDKAYEWLGMAPVFSKKEQQGITIRSDHTGNQTKQLAEEYPKKIWTLNGDYVNPLPGTATEVKKILNKFTENQKQAVVKINTSATERYFKNTDLDQFNIIHLATHGFVNSENPDKSGILFADPDNSPEDGILHTNEIYNISLNTDLVNLSACETGLGKMAKGEGIVGLTRAMLYAGTQNLIVSLWQVYDLSTRNLMIDFYEHQIEQSHNQYFSPSLRKAKLNMIKEGEYAHPFYWAAFILIGE